MQVVISDLTRLVEGREPALPTSNDSAPGPMALTWKPSAGPAVPPSQDVVARQQGQIPPTGADLIADAAWAGVLDEIRIVRA